MNKVWAKIMVGEKIIQDYIYELDEPFNIHHLPIYLLDICDVLNVSVPIILTTHVKNLYLFNTTKFDISDFVGESDFDCLILEIV